ncbi:nitrate reductase molybdenum cofactor assembly chaperone [Psychrobacter sp. FDAARGOS_221]|nr:nitrate reductase molybdenum cofactor assembly chaperone [Psychrobacter sp. FDAARGOS_221]PNK60083.1 nitrate reductase molybdenum cofactor assembly chaperone [Psychrobacter sp. FDAARGOS_221]
MTDVIQNTAFDTDVNQSEAAMPTIADSDMKILKVLSLLIDYPTNELFEGETLAMSKDIVSKSPLISPEVRTQIVALIDELIEMGSLEAQAQYDGLFERGRSLSLWLFEHVHGESRDRGQAMVDLMGQYEEAGFVIDQKELPDYLPMYLEFLAYQAAVTGDEIKIRMDIADVSHIIALLAARLKDRDSLYEGCFNALLQIAGKPLDAVKALEEQVQQEQRDDTFEALDQEWEEEVVDFLGAQQEERCPSSTQNLAKGIAIDRNVMPPKQVDAPVHWVDFDKPKSVKQP